MNDKDRNTGATADDRLLFETENGWVGHCARRDVLVLYFAGHWIALTRLQYRDVHARIIATVRCPIGQRQLNAGGRFAFRGHENGEPAFSLDRLGMEELLWLLDSAHFMLEAQDAAQRGYHSDTDTDVAPPPGRSYQKEPRKEP